MRRRQVPAVPAVVSQEQPGVKPMEFQSTRVDCGHANHGIGDADGPRDSDCTCRGTREQSACAAAGCGFCRVAERREVREMNAPGEPLDVSVELPVDRCARGLHEQMESEPWRCVYDEGHLDLNSPDGAKLVVVFAPWLVAERSDAHNWTLKVRRKVESGTNAGKYSWKDNGYYATPGRAATRALHMLTEKQEPAGGMAFHFLVKKMAMVEENLRTVLEPVVRAEAREKALADALAVVRDEKDKERIKKLFANEMKK